MLSHHSECDSQHLCGRVTCNEVAPFTGHLRGYRINLLYPRCSNHVEDLSHIGSCCHPVVQGGAFEDLPPQGALIWVSATDGAFYRQPWGVWVTIHWAYVNDHWASVAV